MLAEELYNMRNNTYSDFVDLLIDIAENTSCNSRQLQILILLDFFEEFGNSNELMQIYTIFDKRYSKKHKPKTKANRILEIRESILDINAKPFTPDIKIQNELLYLGYAETTVPHLPSDYVMVTAIEKKYTHPMVTLYTLCNGQSETIKCKNNVFDNNPFEVFDLLKVTEKKQDFKWKKNPNGKGFIRSEEKEWLLTKYSIVK
jgi:DNA polymerase-3 subunit alpha